MTGGDVVPYSRANVVFGCSVNTKLENAHVLVLSRKKNESIVIGTSAGLVTVTVVEIRGEKVRLGIEGPREVPVHRQEVYEQIHGKPGGSPKDPDS